MVSWQRQFGETTRGRIVALLRRGQRSVEELAGLLGVTDNAVRAQLTALERDGLVSAAGVRRSGTAGKPATVYGLAPGTDALFSRAYAPVLAALLHELGNRLPPAELDGLLRGVGRRLAPGVTRAAAYEDRVHAAAALLGDLGGDADLARTETGHTILAHGCPLARAVSARPETCRALEQLLAEMTGTSVHEQCDRGVDGPRCRFAISAPEEPSGSR